MTPANCYCMCFQQKLFVLVSCDEFIKAGELETA